MSVIRKHRTFLKVFFSILLCSQLLIIMTTDKVHSSPKDDLSRTDSEENVNSIEELANTISYDEYLEKYNNAIKPEIEIVIEANDYIEIEPYAKTFNNYEGMEGTSIFSDEEGFIKWIVDVPETGLYNIQIDYFPVEGKGMPIERTLKINDEVPFDGVEYISLSRLWIDKTGITRDANDNDRRPSQIEAPTWQSYYFKDNMGYHLEPYSFYFEKGKNTIELSSVQDMMLIRRLILTQAEEIPSYEEVKKEYEENKYEVVELDNIIKVQAEDSKIKSDAMLFPTFDRSTPATEPSHPTKIRLNTIGGESWQSMGQWITWDIEVPESGLYEIGVKYLQNFKSGTYVSRTLLIDGEIPFKEAANLSFDYGNSWENNIFGNEDPYLFYLEKGSHEITLEVSLGDLSDLIKEVEDSLFELNYAYRQLLMIIGSTPDLFRDYQLEKRVPEALSILDKQKTVLENVSSSLAGESGQKGASTSVLDTLVVQLNSINKNPKSIPERWAAFQNNLSSLGAWLLDMQEQPLQLDYLFLTSDSAKVPKASSSLLESLSYTVKSFIGSFTEDYTSIGSDEEDALTVWVNSRDYGNIINSLVENNFSVMSDVPVNVEIVNSETLLPATLAGMGPDVALQVPIGDPVNYAIRNAVVDLNDFDDFEDVADRFLESALVPYRFDGGVYALPETQTFPMMFYRKDIFEELEIKRPDTWDDLYMIMPTIQKNNMNIGIPINGVSGTGSLAGIESTLSSYTMFLYQNNGTLYSGEGITSAVDDEEAIQAFQEWTSLFVNYSIPVQYDFANRFRTGEMPIGIADYSTYNYLSVFAPELKGLWEMVPVPGTITDNDMVDRSVGSSGTNSIILKNSNKHDEAWEFLKWWTSAEIQANFGRELESIIGVAARYATANIEAVEILGWPSRVYRNFSEQWDWVEGNPEVPGGYFTPRHMENAFRKVYNDLDDPRETILDYAITINLEIANKRKEFGLETIE